MDKDIWRALLERARKYPSPHNSQPIKVRVLGNREAEFFYDLDLGLPAENYGIPFGHVCAGVFLESLATVAAASGFRVVESLEHGDMDFDAPERLHRLGTLRLEPHDVENEDLARLAAYEARQTSRLPYDAATVPAAVLASVASVVEASGQRFSSSDQSELVNRIIRVNQETLFDDLQNDAVHAEILQWLRYSEEQARERGDGLSAATMLMPGPALKFAMKHRGLWQAPVMGAVIRRMYLRTMRGVTQVGWLEGPFSQPADYVEAGRAFMRVWLEFTLHGVYLHPFGTVITNPRSHQEFVRVAGIEEGPDSMAWMLFRFGYSKVPPIAHRRPTEEMIVA
ncbi:hypothetical protein [Demequina aurantiaca]|uniref:hypothetical protein n=1 Tax=Demequina aurantiaca TaxID=676200 RepID=UPI003D32E99F